MSLNKLNEKKEVKLADLYLSLNRAKYTFMSSAEKIISLWKEMNELDCKSLSDEDEYLLLENINDFADKAVTLLSTRKDSVE